MRVAFALRRRVLATRRRACVNCILEIGDWRLKMYCNRDIRNDNI